MRTHTAWRLLLPLLAVCLLSAQGWGGGGYDACLREEKRLQAEEADQCSGMSYFFNPSACFNTRKALAPFSNGKCRDVAAQEGVVQQVKPAAAPLPAEPATGSHAATEAQSQPQPESPPVALLGGLVSPAELEQLRNDIDKMQAELQRLKDELIRLMK